MLVAVPLALQLVFLIVLFAVLWQSDRSLEKTNRAREITSEAINISRTFEAAANAMGGYCQTKNDLWLSQYQKQMSALKSGAEQLSKAGEVETDLEAAIRSYLKSINEGVRILEATKESAETSELQLTRIQGMRLSREIRSVSNSVLESCSAFSRLQPELLSTATKQKSHFRNLLINAILFGGVTSLLAGVAVAIAFNKSVAQRLDVLADNSLRLASNRELNPPLSGTDELTTLDQTFRQMAEALEQASRREKAVLENAVDVICSIDADFRFTGINAACTASWGYEPEELIGRRAVSLLSKDTANETLSKLDQLKESGKHDQFEAAIRRQDGRLVEVNWSVSWSEFDRQYFCVIHDISRQKRLENLRREFVSMISHDLKTPLTSFQCFLEGFAAGMYDDSPAMAKERATEVDADIGRLVGMVITLLDVEKFEAGKMETDKRMFAVQNLVQTCIQSVKSLAEKNQVTITDNEPDIFVLGDKDQLIRVVVNLLSNAIKYSPPNETVDLSVVETDEWIEFSVTDHGKGIPESFQDKIFNRFEQVELADTKLKGGTGLGLTICKAIVDAHNGEIGVRSQEGQGSTFWFRLPIEPESA